MVKNWKKRKVAARVYENMQEARQALKRQDSKWRGGGKNLL
jgi:hypothetical protein